MKRSLHLLLFCVLLLAGTSAFAQGTVDQPAPPMADGTIDPVLGRVLDSALAAAASTQRGTFSRPALERLYASGRLHWIDGGQPRASAAAAIAALEQAHLRGLDPAQYQTAMLRGELARPAPFSEVDAARFDTRLSLNLLRMFVDVHRGRVDPKTVAVGMDVVREPVDLARIVAAVAAGSDPTEAVAALEPSVPQYGRLIAALARARVRASTVAEPDLPDVTRVRPGESWEGVSELRRYLTALGYLEHQAAPAAAAQGSMVNLDVIEGATASAASSSATDVLDESLADAVRGFQAHHGVGVDGVIGPATLAALRVPLEHRALQVELALERLRWLPRPSGRRFIIVNVPAFELLAFDPSISLDRPVLPMRVVVGKALDTETPIFAERMRYVVFRPYWNVPETIASEEIYPKALVAPDYLESNDYELVSGYGANATVLETSPENIERLGLGAVRVRQRPGPRNSLGLVKFIFPNRHDVYLHSTPTRYLFARSRRDFSHGCVRVEHPRTLAEFVLQDLENWDAERIANAFEEGGPTYVNLPTPMPVYIFYSTAMSEPDGRVRFFNDIYGHDETLAAALAGMKREDAPRTAPGSEAENFGSLPGAEGAGVQMHKIGTAVVANPASL